MKRNLLTILLCAVLAIIGTTSCEKENWREPDYSDLDKEENVEGEENGDQTGGENEGEQGGENEGEGGENEGEGGENEGGENEGEGGNEEVVVKNVELTKFLNITDYLAQYQINIVGVELGTDGMIAETWTWGEMSGVTVKGNGDHLKLEVYTEDGKLAAGTYTACTTEGAPGPGEFNYGYDVTQDYNGQSYTSVYGSCLSAYENDQPVSQTKITDGTVTVEVDGDIYTITLTSSTVNATYVGEIPQGTTPDEGGENEGEGGNEDVVVKNLELTTFLSFSDYVAQSQGQTKLVGMELGSAGMTVTEQQMSMGDYTWTQMVIGGSGYDLKIEFYSEDGTLAAGTYTACTTEGAPGPGEFNYGFDVEYDYTQWGGDKGVTQYGTCLYTYENGTVTAVEKIADGTATVEVNGDIYTITLTSSNLNATYSGKLSYDSGSDEGDNEEEVFDGLELITFLSFSDYVAQSQGQTKLVGMELGSAGMTVTEQQMSMGDYTWTQMVIGGSGYDLKIEFYSEDGTLAAGTYTACTTEGAPGPGEFNYGFDVEYDYTQWGGDKGVTQYGTCLYTYENGTITGVEKVSDGTATVEVNGDVYTITLKSSTINAKYVGKLSAE